MTLWMWRAINIFSHPTKGSIRSYLLPTNWKFSPDVLTLPAVEEGRERGGWRCRRRRWRKDAIKRRENNFTEHHRDVHVERLQCRCSNDMAGGVSEGCSWWCRKVARIGKSIIKIGFGCVVRHNNSIWQKALLPNRRGNFVALLFHFSLSFLFYPQTKTIRSFRLFLCFFSCCFQFANCEAKSFCLLWGLNFRFDSETMWGKLFEIFDASARCCGRIALGSAEGCGQPTVCALEIMKCSSVTKPGVGFNFNRTKCVFRLFPSA